MSGIATGTGLISGIDTGSLISQLLSLEARPRTVLQRRIAQLQTQQASYLDVNSRLSAIRTAATAFGTRRIFSSSRASSGDADVLTASAGIGAAVGTYSFLVDRLVSTQQQFSRGYLDRNATPAGLTSLTFEGEEGRLDRDSSLSALNGGQGVQRGSIQITDASGATAVVDLSRVSTVNEVLEAINSAEGIDVTARVDGDHFVITNTATGTGGVVVRNHGDTTTATSLGIENTTPGSNTINGTSVHRLAGTTLLQTLNDGNGVRVGSNAGTNPRDFDIVVTNGSDTKTINVNLGEIKDSEGVVTSPRTTTTQQVLERINAAALQTGVQYVTSSISTDGSGFTLTAAGGYTISSVTDITGAAEDLGIKGTPGTNVLTGNRVLAGINTTLIRNIQGGRGLDSGTIDFKTRDGSSLSAALSGNGSITDLISELNAIDPTKIRASLNENATGIILTDLTSGSDSFAVSGDQAVALGLEKEAAAGAATISSDRVQHRYIYEGTALSSLNGGRGVGTGRFEITDSTGETSIVDIGSDSRTIGDVIQEINSRPLNVKARINDNGDGIILEEEDPDAGGSIKMKIRDLGGSVADGLNIAGEAKDATDHNYIDGSFERVVALSASDTLDQIATKVNQADVGATVSVISDGSATAPYHLSFTSARTGRAGRFTLDGAGESLGLSTLSRGDDARVFYGSSNPANAVLLTSSTNDLDGIINGVSIDLKSTSEDLVTLTVSRDTGAIETAVNTFITAYNSLTERIDTLTAYDAETQRRGVLLGDSTVEQVRLDMFNAVNARPDGVSGPYQTLAQVGIKFGRDGKLELDGEKLRAAIQANPQAVSDLFSAKIQNPAAPEEVSPGVTISNRNAATTYSSLGVFEKIAQRIDKYIDRSSGVLTRRKTTIDSQIGAQNTQIGQIDARLARRRGVLERQFATMESALAQLQTQQSSLAGLRNLVG